MGLTQALPAILIGNSIYWQSPLPSSTSQPLWRAVYKRVLSYQVLWLRCAHSGNAVDTTCGALDQIGPDVFILLRARFVMDVARPRGSCFAPCKLLDLTRRTETTAVATKFTRYGRCGDVDGARPVTAVMGRLRHFGGRIVLLGEKLYLQSFGCYREAKPAMNF